MTTRGQDLGDAVIALAAHRAAATKARRTAREKAESAIEHGWDGLAYEYGLTGELLDAAATELSAARASLQQASSMIDDALVGEVILGAQLLESACSQLDEARACAEVVGDDVLIDDLRELAENLQAVSETVNTVRDELEDDASQADSAS